MTYDLTKYIAEGEILLPPNHTDFLYNGRIDKEDSSSYRFVYAASSVKAAFDTPSLKGVFVNHRSYGENYIGAISGSKSLKFRLNDEGVTVVDFADFIKGAPFEIMIYKRQDACHYVDFLGFIVPKNATVNKPAPLPKRKMEFFGDSVTCGEVCEAIDRCGLSDPEGHEGRLSDSYYSYSYMTARKLSANLHITAQGGISLLDGEGYFSWPETVGMLSCYDKIEYYPGLGETKPWDFSEYTPNVVVVAIGQNDANPDNYMEKDYNGEKAKNWREKYKFFLAQLRKIYPNATIITATTILNHSKEWDDAIKEVTESMGDGKMHYFRYTHTGCGTHGHIRIPEADLMSDELSAFIRSLGEDIWQD